MYPNNPQLADKIELMINPDEKLRTIDFSTV